MTRFQIVPHYDTRCICLMIDGVECALTIEEALALGIDLRANVTYWMEFERRRLGNVEQRELTQGKDTRPASVETGLFQPEEKPTEIQYPSVQQSRLREGFLVLDTETSGFGPEAEILQISIYDSEGTELLSTFVRPKRWIDEKGAAFGVNGISNKMVSKSPRFADLHPQLREVLEGKIVYAYNARFDRDMIAQECERAGLPMFDCVWKCAMKAFMVATGRTKGIKLEAACRERGITVGETHEAGADVRLTIELLRSLSGERETVA